MDDLISRQAAIDALYELYHNRPLDYGRIRMRGDVLNTIENVPSAERRGRWIESDIKNEKYVCSVCGGACWYYDYQGEVAKSNYCPNCGASMVNEDV